MPPSVSVAVVTLLAVFGMMAGEALLSWNNERVLRRRGALEPPGDVYAMMRVVYPASFLVMAFEGGLVGPADRTWMVVGFAVFGLAKALKLWAITTLGVRWTFRVLVLPGVPLIKSGPYRLLRHPNYLAVLGELVGVALIVRAPFTGVLAALAFGGLILKRIRTEEQSLGL